MSQKKNDSYRAQSCPSGLGHSDPFPEVAWSPTTSTRDSIPNQPLGSPLCLQQQHPSPMTGWSWGRWSQAWTLWWVLARNVVGDRTPYKLPTCPYIVLRLMGWRASLVTQTVKKLPIMQETWVWTLGWGDPLKKGTATHSSVLAWRIPMDRGAWWAMVHWGRKESDMTEQLSAHTRWGDTTWRC